MNRKLETLEEATELARQLLIKGGVQTPDVLRMLHDDKIARSYAQRSNAELLADADTDPFAWEELVLRIVGSVDQDGRVPNDLRRFHRRVLWGDSHIPSRRRGAPSAFAVHRAVVLSVNILNRLGVRQRDPVSKRLPRVSAIRAVAAAMNGLGQPPKTYAAVEDVWRNLTAFRAELDASRIHLPELEIDLDPRR